MSLITFTKGFNDDCSVFKLGLYTIPTIKLKIIATANASGRYFILGTNVVMSFFMTDDLMNNKYKYNINNIIVYINIKKNKKKVRRQFFAL